MNQVTDITKLLSDIAVQAATGQYTHADDAEFFSTGRVDDAKVRERILIERLIIRTAVTDLLADLRSITVYHEGESCGVNRSRDLAAIMSEIGACDCASLGVFTPGIIGRYGVIHLIHGNDGWDVMQDYSTKLGVVLNRAQELADAIGDAL